MKSGIYIILNKKNGKVYVGSSKNIKRRWHTHRRLLKIKEHTNLHLQASWNKYGKMEFEFSVVEYCAIESLKEREGYWIRLYDSINQEKGYNMEYPDTRKGCRNPEKVQGTKLRIPIICIEKSTGKVHRHTSMEEAANTYSLNRDQIRRVCKMWKDGKGDSKSLHGKVFLYEDCYNTEFDYVSKPKKEKRSYKMAPEDLKPSSEWNVKRLKIRALNKETGEEIIYEKGLKPMCREYGFCHTIVRKCIDRPFKERSHHGWWFEKL